MIHVSTDSYVLSHGRRPSGYGMWAFQVLDDSSVDVTAELDRGRAEEAGIKLEYSPDGAIAWVSSRTYAEAKRAIIDLARGSYGPHPSVTIDVLT
jgi:hypothetical protein